MPPSTPPHDSPSPPFLLLFPYPSIYALCLSLSPSPSPSFFFFSFFFYFLSRSLSRRIFFAEAFRGDSRNNEWTWKRDGQSYSCSLAGAHLPPVRLACSFGGRGREREREEEKVSRSRFIPISLHAVCILLYPLSCSSIRPIYEMVDKHLLLNCLEREWFRLVERENRTRRFRNFISLRSEGKRKR